MKNVFNEFLSDFEDGTKRIEDFGRILTKDIVEVPEWVTRTTSDDEGKEKHFKRILIKIKDEEVDCPISVLIKLKAISEKLNKQVKAFTVIKSGAGLKTTYDVMPDLEELTD